MVDFSSIYLPNVSLNMGYGNGDGITPVQLLKIYLSLSDTFKLRELFDNTDKQDPVYQFKGMICYLGAHYISLFRLVNSDFHHDITLADQHSYGRLMTDRWVMYDDTTVKEFLSWDEVIKTLVDALARPTMVFYQQLHEDAGPSIRNTIEISATFLAALERNAANATLRMKELDGASLVANRVEIERQKAMLEHFQKQKKLTLQKSQIKLKDSIVNSATKMQDSKQTLPKDTDSTVQEVPDPAEERREKKRKKEEIRKLKAKYAMDNIFLFNCHKCLAWMDLSDKVCPTCRTLSYYYDEKLRVDEALSKKVKQEIKDILASTQKSPKPQLKIDEEVKVPSLKEETKVQSPKQKLVESTTEQKVEEKEVVEEMKQETEIVKPEKPLVKLNPKVLGTVQKEKVPIMQILKEQLKTEESEQLTARKMVKTGDDQAKSKDLIVDNRKKPKEVQVKSFNGSIEKQLGKKDDAENLESQRDQYYFQGLQIIKKLVQKPKMLSQDMPVEVQPQKIEESALKFNQQEQVREKDYDSQHSDVANEQKNQMSKTQNDVTLAKGEKQSTKFNMGRSPRNLMNQIQSMQNIEEPKYECPGFRGIRCGRINKISEECRCGFNFQLYPEEWASDILINEENLAAVEMTNNNKQLMLQISNMFSHRKVIDQSQGNKL